MAIHLILPSSAQVLQKWLVKVRVCQREEPDRII